MGLFESLTNPTDGMDAIAQRAEKQSTKDCADQVIAKSAADMARAARWPTRAVGDAPQKPDGQSFIGSHNHGRL